jgi:hypothetical protein
VQCLDSSGNVISLDPLLGVSPEKPVLLSAEVDFHPGAVLLQLVVKPQTGEHLLLAESRL